ncbi:MAG: hypothetical protein K0S90_3416 [Enterobacteriaceae bacterium]|jgi:hypothetical protein|nr:hypothetical protein [Enterobacteriaceae bacterium]
MKAASAGQTNYVVSVLFVEEKAIQGYYIARFTSVKPEICLLLGRL